MHPERAQQCQTFLTVRPQLGHIAPIPSDIAKAEQANRDTLAVSNLAVEGDALAEECLSAGQVALFAE